MADMVVEPKRQPKPSACWWIGSCLRLTMEQALDLQLAVVSAKITGGRLDADVIICASNIPGSLRWAVAAAGKIFASAMTFLAEQGVAVMYRPIVGATSHIMVRASWWSIR
jgi:hypothetical protein